jgi:hypothetical protein
MSEPMALPDADRCGEPLTLKLAPALSEYLRTEAARRSLEPAELAQRLLMRGLHQQRLDDVLSELCPGASASSPSSEALLAARLEAGAMLGVFAADTPALSTCPPPLTSCTMTREFLDRFRGRPTA